MPLTIQELDSKVHDRDAFDCGSEPLNVFLKRSANQAKRNNVSRTYVMFDDDNPSEIIGFITIVMSAIDPSALTGDVAKKFRGVSAVPLIARLGVDQSHQGRGYGANLLQFALLKCVDINEAIGVPFVLVDAKDGAKDFYIGFGFEQSVVNENRLFLTMKDILANLPAK